MTRALGVLVFTTGVALNRVGEFCMSTGERWL